MAAPRTRHADVSKLALRAALVVLLCAGMIPGTSAEGIYRACYKENLVANKVCSVDARGTSGTGAATSEKGTCTTSCSRPKITLTPEPPRSSFTTRVECTCVSAPNPSPGGNGDPHFDGPEGIKYDFHGEKDKDFCLISDTRFHMNSHFIGQETEHTGFTGTWMDSFFLIYTSEDGQIEHTVHVAVADRPDASLSSNLT
ncbi:hypothetical protein KFL_001950080 [Klebsormidium nitens]|uniref:Uncharacterized protein n=1 Tax=Klebsormidium nitens TaxID=105231 RepID=A0A1Y1I0Y2_KLENI|nr:hypothetical protein KFL_001950080 [Klebsormidium nitens]|eukprot:GAQ84575.1 hypothetical protein KFL_001950080 [Klebsormidium nitens]